jgi:dCMP deaminase
MRGPLRTAAKLAKLSPDLSTQNGAVIVRPDGVEISGGWNAPPHPSVAIRHERPEKYVFTEHAERMAIFNAARNGHSTEDCTMFAVWAACNECARAIIAAGITRVVTLPHHRVNPSNRWDLRTADAMLAEAGVELVIVDLTVDVALRYNGEVVSL